MTLLHPRWDATLPLFALANVGVALDAAGVGPAPRQPVTLGVIAGLVLGKPLGVLAAAGLARATRLASLPPGRQLVAPGRRAGLLAGIGFTVALFIAGLAFPPGDLDDAARLGILAASLLAGAAGAGLLTLPGRPRPARRQADGARVQPDTPGRSVSPAPDPDAAPEQPPQQALPAPPPPTREHAAGRPSRVRRGQVRRSRRV